MTKELIFTLNDGKIKFYSRISPNDAKIWIADESGAEVFLPLSEASYDQMINNLKSDIFTLALRAD